MNESDIPPAVNGGASSRLFLRYGTPLLAQTGAFRRALRALSALRGSCFIHRTRSPHAAPPWVRRGGLRRSRCLTYPSTGSSVSHRRRFGCAPAYSNNNFRLPIHTTFGERSPKVFGGSHPLPERRRLPAAKVKVEPLSLKDAAKIEALFKEVWPIAVEYPEKWRKKRTLSREEIVKEMKEGYYYFGVRASGRIVGVYKASIKEDGILGEHQSVHPTYRGQGLAVAMYRQLIDFAREKKCKRVYVNILPNQIASKKCVDELGFRKKGDPYEQAKGMIVQMYERNLEAL